MTSVRGRRRPRRKRSSATLSVAPLDFFPLSELAVELSDQPARPSGAKPPVANALAATSVPKYSKDDLQRILKAVLKARAPVSLPAPVPAPTPVRALAFILAPTPIVVKTPWEKLKARSLDVYRGKSYMDYYNFCQQCENYFTTARVTGLTRIPFASSFLLNRISFRWQLYKRRYDAKTLVSVT